MDFTTSPVFGDVTPVTMSLWALAFLIGFVVGGGLKHSLKIVLILLGVVVAAGFFAPSAIGSLSGVLTFVNPLNWVTQILGMTSASILVVVCLAGLVVGLWKG